MRRTIIMALLGLGVIAGYGSGFAHLAHWRHYQEQQREALVHSMAERCTEAAVRQQPPPPPQFVPNFGGSGPTIITIGVPATVSH